MGFCNNDGWKEIKIIGPFDWRLLTRFIADLIALMTNESGVNNCDIGMGIPINWVQIRCLLLIIVRENYIEIHTINR